MFSQPIFQARKNIRGFLEQAMYVGSVRGRDSTGMMLVDRISGDVEVIKGAVDGAHFCDGYNVDKAMSNLEDNIAVVIHNRKATMGATTAINAHPHQHEGVTLVHNGTLYNHRSIGGGNQFRVDSQAIAYAMGKQSKIATLEELDGAFSLIWHDENDFTLNIARNDQRPLHVGFVKGENTLLFCSERKMLEWLAFRNSLALEKTLTPAVDTLYTWDLTKNDLKVNDYVATPFDSMEQWTGFDGVGTRYISGCSTAARAQHQAQKQYVPPRQFEADPLSNRAERDKALEKYSLKVGDVIPFHATRFDVCDRFQNKCTLMGLDVMSAFEVVAYMMDVPDRREDLEDCLCNGRIICVKDTAGYPDWITVVVGSVEVTQKNYRKSQLREAAAESARGLLPPPGEDSSNDDGLPGEDDEALDADYKEVNANYLATVEGPAGEDIPMEEWNQLTKGGCSNCSCNLIDPEETFWTVNDDPLCEDCYNEVVLCQSAGLYH